MRVLVGVIGILVSLPWLIAFGVFRQNFPPRQQLAAGLIGLASGVCLIIAAGSLVSSAWHPAAVGVVAVQGLCVAALWVAGKLHQRKRQ